LAGRHVLRVVPAFRPRLAAAIQAPYRDERGCERCSVAR
jgi:hypothetical protein